MAGEKFGAEFEIKDSATLTLQNARSEIEKTEQATDKFGKTTKTTAGSVKILGRNMDFLRLSTLATRISIVALGFALVNYVKQAEKAARASEETQKNLERELYLIEQNESAWEKFKNIVGETTIKIKAANIDMQEEAKIRAEATALILADETGRRLNLEARNKEIEALVAKKMADREAQIQADLTAKADKRAADAAEERTNKLKSLIDAFNKETDAITIKNELADIEDEKQRELMKLEIAFNLEKQNAIIAFEKAKEIIVENIALYPELSKRIREITTDYENQKNAVSNLNAELDKRALKSGKTEAGFERTETIKGKTYYRDDEGNIRIKGQTGVTYGSTKTQTKTK